MASPTKVKYYEHRHKSGQKSSYIPMDVEYGKSSYIPTKVEHNFFDITEQMIERYKQLYRYVGIYNQSLLIKEAQNQKELEKDGLKYYESLITDKQITMDLKNLDFYFINKIKNELNYNTVTKISIVLESIFYENKFNLANNLLPNIHIKMVNPLSPNERGREYIKDLKRIGNTSVYGIAMTETLKNNRSEAKDLFIIKTSSKPEYNYDIIHECIVGFYGTNKLRDVGIPNFAYVYGAFSGSPTFYNDVDKKVISFIDTMKDPVNYIMYENINPSIPLSEYCTKCSAEEFLLYYCQIIYALLYANKDIGFTHYDSHTNNILMRKISNGPFYIAYPDLVDKNKKHYFLSKGYIPTFIDYGMSHITYYNNNKKEDFGALNNNLISSSIFRDRPFFFHDAYKILMFSLRYMKNYNNPSYDELKSLSVYFFNKQISDDELEKIYINTNFNLPYTQATSGLDEEQWNAFTKKYNINIPFDANDTNYITPKDYFDELVYFYNSKFKPNVFTNNYDETKQIGNVNYYGTRIISTTIPLITSPPILTLSEFYDIYGLLYENNDIENIILLVGDFIKNKYYIRDEALKKLSNFNIELEKNIKVIKIDHNYINDLNYINYIKYNFNDIVIYMNNYNNFCTFLHIIRRLFLKNNAVLYLYKEDYNGIYNSYFEKLNQYKEKVNELNRDINWNISLINEYKKIKKILNDWYTNTYSLLPSLFILKRDKMHII